MIIVYNPDTMIQVIMHNNLLETLSLVPNMSLFSSTCLVLMSSDPYFSELRLNNRNADLIRALVETGITVCVEMGTSLSFI